MMNKEVLTLLDGRLREGRLMDVMQIARSISKHRRSIVISNTLRYTHTHALAYSLAYSLTH